MVLYYKIQEAWRVARYDTRDDMEDPYAESKFDKKAQALEALLADRFESSLKQYNQGLISASELFTKLYIAAYDPIKPEEQDTL